MSCEVFLALGSNKGDREENLIEAIERIRTLEGTVLKAVSDIYETDPVGYTEQDSFLNMAVLIHTKLQPVELLENLQKIETLLKRTREIRWGPRTIDIDILLYGEMQLDLPMLQIPHPRMFERAFALVPLKDIYPGRNVMGRDMSELIDRCGDKAGVKFYRKYEGRAR